MRLIGPDCSQNSLELPTLALPMVSKLPCALILFAFLALIVPTGSADILDDAKETIDCVSEGDFVGSYEGLGFIDHVITTSTGTTITQTEPPVIGYVYTIALYDCGQLDGETLYGCEIAMEEGTNIHLSGVGLSEMLYKAVVKVSGNGSCGGDGSFEFRGGLLDGVCTKEPCTNVEMYAYGDPITGIRI